MYLDINSCFATIEQQANPFLRGVPTVVAAYTTSYGCILASSREAKKLGIKTGMRVKDGQALYPGLIVLAPDPPKYRFVHKKLKQILLRYTNEVTPKSIDEFAMEFKDYSILEYKSMWKIAEEIKLRIKEEIGEFITVSIGISTNRYLAKTAASYKKPDGLFEINRSNYKEVFRSLKLTDLCGIKKGNAGRLATVGITTVLDFYNADIQKLKTGFRSINGYYWYLRLHGYEVDDYISTRKSFGNSYALPRLVSEAGLPSLLPILTKLTEKMARRLRRKGYVAEGVHLGILFRDYTYWHKGMKLPYPVFASDDFCRVIFKLFKTCPTKAGIRNLAVTCFNLQKQNFLQLDMSCDVIKKENLTKALDAINEKWGDFTVSSARMGYMQDKVIDRIAFGQSEI